ncbi:hypothetical protein, variant [Blastomyces gilchristii SLH14081]|uniref:Uncharacterized protein n=1 Tax=Blastomyces gilchristii (strain SLH14081) TaxID=559298 RepID=A0A179URN1_BLAGS|nr:hypothetical protein, variant [Blastomyces gilchristii SLH14081]XP_031579496.1 uncharacterized protein BDBG_06562 [Blastomyces gilchristii SLH14081]OAT10764.1 hypothetical protein BDBG_06562 [Blastomyces gilchristii SLH14081]OAT10765.1 hypothetical protein, variant [Blastomyces gilchristii SLH14081]
MHFSVPSLGLGLALSLAMCVVADGVSHKRDVDVSNKHKHDHGHKPRGKDGDVYDLLKTLNTDPLGFGHLGDDGVYRMYNRNGTVIDYLLLSSDEIEELIENSPLKEQDKNHMRNLLGGVNSTNVDLQQIWFPAFNLRPHKLKYPDSLQRRGQRPPTSPVPGGLKEPPPRSRCTDITCFDSDPCWEVRCMLCSFWDDLPMGNCV